MEREKKGEENKWDGKKKTKNNVQRGECPSDASFADYSACCSATVMSAGENVAYKPKGNPFIASQNTGRNIIPAHYRAKKRGYIRHTAVKTKRQCTSKYRNDSIPKTSIWTRSKTVPGREMWVACVPDTSRWTDTTPTGAKPANH